MKMVKWLGLIMIATSANWAQADVVSIPVSLQPGNYEAERPQPGMNKNRVEERFGAPIERRGPVGDPAISRWEYRDYVVYFEHDTVLHSVVKHRRQAQAD